MKYNENLKLETFLYGKKAFMAGIEPRNNSRSLGDMEKIFLKNKKGKIRIINPIIGHPLRIKQSMNYS